MNVPVIIIVNNNSKWFWLNNSNIYLFKIFLLLELKKTKNQIIYFVLEINE